MRQRDEEKVGISDMLGKTLTKIEGGIGSDEI